MSLLPFSALLFDFDGVIAHTAPAFKQALWTFFREKQINMLRSDFEADGHFTKSLQQTAEIVQKKYGHALNIDEMMARINPLQYELFDEHLEFDPMLIPLLETCRSMHITLAIGSNSRTPRIEWVLEKMKIRTYFDIIIGAEQLEKHKPDPEVWLRCAEKLGLPIAQCLVIEDGLPGLTWAKACGAQSLYYHRFCRIEKACQEIANINSDNLGILISQ